MKRECPNCNGTIWNEGNNMPHRCKTQKCPNCNSTYWSDVISAYAISGYIIDQDIIYCYDCKEYFKWEESK